MFLPVIAMLDIKIRKLKNNNAKLKIDDFGKPPDYRKIVLMSLRNLKSSVLSKPEIIAQQVLLSAKAKKRVPVFNFLNFSALRQASAFASIASLILVVVFGASFYESAQSLSREVLGTATAGLSLAEGQDFGNARQKFVLARNQIKNSNELLIKLINISPLGANVDKLFSASEILLSSLDNLTSGMKAFEGLNLGWDKTLNASSQDFYSALKNSKDYFVKSRNDLSSASTLMKTTNPSLLPGSLRGNLITLKNQVETAHDVLSQITRTQGFVLNLLGGEKKTYLLIFQNNNEARATGGFIGTYGLVDLENGKIKINKIESIYALDGQLKEKIAAPGPLQRQVTENWALRDANWFVDFELSSRKLLEFLEKEAGILASGVISFTPDVFEDLLQLTGPIAMPEYAEILTAENFREVVQRKTSIEYDKKLNQPKKFLSDFAPQLLEKLGQVPQSDSTSLYEILSRQISRKNLMAFSLEQEIQEQIRDYGAAGNIRDTTGDYLGVFHTNVGGGKTDIGITQTVQKHVTIRENAQPLVKLLITRTHNQGNEKYFPKNIDFMRILVPHGSKLITARGFDDYPLKKSVFTGSVTDIDLAAWDAGITWNEDQKIYIGYESGYTMFANFLELDPGQTKTIELTYVLPAMPEGEYSQILQTQPGSKGFDFEFTIEGQWEKLAYFFPETFHVSENKLFIANHIETDQFFGLVYE